MNTADTADFLQSALSQPPDAIGYAVSRALANAFLDKGIVAAGACAFDLDEYAGAGECWARVKPGLHSRLLTEWQGKEHGLGESADSAWHVVEWQGQTLEVVSLSWTTGFHRQGYVWILADSKEVAETFFATVCEWCSEVRGEVLVFEAGGWHKSAELFQAIQASTFDTLILPAALKDEIQTDFAQFFAARAAYERYNLPWKRGILLVGPPGNGKTHTVKALINSSGQPCLYVKSFKDQYGDEHANIRKVFARARQTTPCILVLEDLDSLLDGGNRSFFLNELDGFAANTGIVALATTNHPERLDPAILERPSRFDRKYHFALPAADERRAFLRRWNESVDADMRLSDDALTAAAAQTEDYSFAYLKELWLSAMMRWIAAPTPGAMDAIFAVQAETLRAQMQAAPDEGADAITTDDADGGPMAMFYHAMQRARG